MRGREKESKNGCVILCLRERDREREREARENIRVGVYVTFACVDVSWDTCEFAYKIHSYTSTREPEHVVRLIGKMHVKSKRAL